MNAEQWNAAKSLLLKAADVPADQRAAFLERECPDTAVRAELLAMLANPASLSDVLAPPVLVAGTRLGSYVIESLLGAGGMGQVYRARDTRLAREAAIKILPPILAHDPERLQRFEREAKVLASLNHPNIAHVYGLESADGVQALVMEVVEGLTLAERIAIRPIPIHETLRIAKQIADALEAAHEHGIIHRDLKPANIKVRPDGAVKVLDFGLAKAFASEVTSLTSSTVTQFSAIGNPALSHSGIVLGTAAYMSPEQARGEPVDKRTDIWAFGCVVFELLSGKRAFEGATTAEGLAHVLEHEPDWSALAADTEPAIRRLLRRCLQKDTRRRLRDIADAALEIEEVIAVRQQVDTTNRPAVAARRRRWRAITLVAAISVAAGLAVGAIVWRAPSAGLRVIRTSLDVAPAEEANTGSVLGMLPGGSRTALAWSPDGKTLAFVGLAAGVRRIYLRDLDTDTARPLDGTEGTQSLTFSTDGHWIAFSADGEIRKVRVAGGPPAKICSAVGSASGFAMQVSGISWGPTRIVYTAGDRLFAVSADGGEPQILNQSKFRLSSPVLLPGDAAVLYTEYEKLWTSGDERVIVQSLTPKAAPRVLVRGAADARYLRTGHLALLRQGTVFVVPFSAASLEIRAGEVAVLKGVAQAVASWSGADLTLAGQFAVSAQGTLAYVSGQVPSLPTSELVAVSRSGQITSRGAPADSYKVGVELAPDGTSVVLPLQTATNMRLVLFDLLRKTLTRPPIASEVGEAFSPVWSVDGTIAMSVNQGGVIQLALFRPDSPALARVVPGSRGFVAGSWSHDGKRLVGTRGRDLWMYSSNGESAAWSQLTATPSAESYPAWSPDDRWLAYMSNESGRPQVYVQPFPGPGTAIPVTASGGCCPVWSPRGNELFYVEGRRGPYVMDDQRMMSVDMATPQKPGRPVVLFSFSPASLPLAFADPTSDYSVAPNGQAFYTIRMLPHGPARVTQIHLVLNWFEEMKRLMSAK